MNRTSRANEASRILTEDDVREIRKLADSDLSRAEIAQQFEISKGAVMDIIKGRTWKHVGEGD